MPTHEYNFDGLVGPTHNYAGLSYGNIASMKNASKTSNPRAAALEGLEKMRFIASLGVKQAILPPHERPHLPTLRRLGYSGTDTQILEKVARDDAVLLAAVCSASNMWTANAATVSASADTQDHRVHFTPANLLTQFHRSIEAATTTRILREIFADWTCFEVHEPLSATPCFADEGAANHTRLSGVDGDAGVELFVWGRRGFDQASTTKFPARQTLEACQAICRLNEVRPNIALLLQQNPAAIDAGVFHNDVVSVGHRNVFLMHELTFASPTAADVLRKYFEAVCKQPLHLLTVRQDELSIADAVATYLFNSQLVTKANGDIALIAPIECKEHPAARAVCDRILAADNPIKDVHHVDVRQSMRNGGGPACLRLRVELNDTEARAMHQGVIFTDSLYEQLKQWVTRHYREQLAPADLADPKLLQESRDALDELTKILGLGDVYEFQSM